MLIAVSVMAIAAYAGAAICHAAALALVAVGTRWP